MSKQKTIYLIRHPETNAPDGVCYGRTNVLPSEQALLNAGQKVKQKLKGISTDACYSSPLSRCVLLAEQLTDSDKIITEEALQEIDFAQWEMIPWSDIPTAQQQEWGNDFINCKNHGGENFIDVQRRVVQFWNTLTQSAQQEILIITHAGVIRALLSYLLDASPQKIFAIDIDYAAVIQIKWSNTEYYKLKFL
ncbi:MAG: alpha-ribazole phosphatase [Mangrovibacterium sp.]